jgi:hypothetical protein
MPIDKHGQGAARIVACGHCPWSGEVADMTNGDSFGDGVEKNCPVCGEYYGFVQWPVFVVDNPPAGWKANIGRVAD